MNDLYWEISKPVLKLDFTAHGMEPISAPLLARRSPKGDSITDWWSNPDFGQTNEQQRHFIKEPLSELHAQNTELTRGPPEFVQHFRL
jgi:hypothetical protein